MVENNKNNNNKYIKIRGSYVSIYRRYGDKHPILLHRRVVEPAWIQLWYQISENKFDLGLFKQISDDNQDYLALCFGIIFPDLDNKELNVNIAKKSEYLQKRLLLLEGLIESGNINESLIQEMGQILDKLVSSGQINTRKATRMKLRLLRTYEAIKATVGS